MDVDARRVGKNHLTCYNCEEWDTCKHIGDAEKCGKLIMKFRTYGDMAKWT